MFSYVHPKNVGGHHIPTGMSTSKPWSISNTCKNGKAAKEMQSLEKVHLVGQNESLQLFVSGTKFTIFSPNIKGVVFDRLLLRFSSCLSVREIFVIKLKVIRNHEEFCTFLPSHILLEVSLPKVPPKLYRTSRGNVS